MIVCVVRFIVLVLSVIYYVKINRNGSDDVY